MFVSGVASGGRVVTAQLDSRDGSAGRWHPARLAGRPASRAGCHLPAEPSLESSCAVTTRPPEATPDTNIQVTTKVRCECLPDPLRAISFRMTFPLNLI